ncbi:MAG: DUF2157 domain-containing protein [Pseudomonadota bacterium]
MSRHHNWLARQLPLWVEETLITEAQADALREFYPIKDSLNLGRLLLTGIAAVMIGLGVILLFAYNWAEMGKLSKLAVIFSFLIAAHLSAFFLRSRSHIYSESLFVLGTMLMGAGIFLVGQVYHMDSHYPNAFLFWSLGALALAWALPSLTQGFMAVALVIGWHLFEVFDFRYANHSALLLILLGVMPLLWRLKSPVLARFSSIGLFLTLGLSISFIDGDLVIVSLLLTALTLIAFGRFGEFAQAGVNKDIAAALGGPAVLVMVGAMYLMTFGRLAPTLTGIEFYQVIPAGYLIITAIVSQAAFFRLLYQHRLNGLVWLAELTMILVLLPSIIVWSGGSEDARAGRELVSLGFNVVLLALSVWMMIEGARNANRKHMVRGSILFALLAAARYTDLFESLVARAVVFLLVGAALFAVSHFYQRNKRQVGT